MKPETTSVEGVIPEAREFVAEMFRRAKEGDKEVRGGGSYSHAAMNLACVLAHRAEMENNPEQQRQMIVNEVRRWIELFGEEIIPKLRDELKLVWEEELVKRT